MRRAAFAAVRRDGGGQNWGAFCPRRRADGARCDGFGRVFKELAYGFALLPPGGIDHDEHDERRPITVARPREIGVGDASPAIARHCPARRRGMRQLFLAGGAPGFFLRRPSGAPDRGAGVGFLCGAGCPTIAVFAALSTMDQKWSTMNATWGRPWECRQAIRAQDATALAPHRGSMRV